MYIVRRTPDGEIRWKEIIQARSLEEFAKERAATLKKQGLKHHQLAVVSSQQVDCWDEHGKIIESFLVCEKNPRPSRLITN